MKKIIIRGAREHNLKNVNLKLPRGKFIVFTGVSGSGKSTLAFDTIFAEGQRRYLKSLSSYARQFLSQVGKPDMDLIEGLSPTISINQKTVGRNPRSTVGTVTEIYDYLRLLFAKIGTPFCPRCGTEIKKNSLEEIIKEISKEFRERAQIQIYAPVNCKTKEECQTVLGNLYEQGFAKVIINGELVKLSTYRFLQFKNPAPYKMKVLIDELKLNSKNSGKLAESLERALRTGKEKVVITQGKKVKSFGRNMKCPNCGYRLKKIELNSFSFNSPNGACPVCNGLGKQMQVSLKLIMPDLSKTIGQGGIFPYSYRRNKYFIQFVNSAARVLDISLNTPLGKIPRSQLNKLLLGKGKPIVIKIKEAHHPTKAQAVTFPGIIKYLENYYHNTESKQIKKEIEKYMIKRTCPACHGARLKPDSLLIKIKGKNISEIANRSIKDLIKFFRTLKFTQGQELVAKRIKQEIVSRLTFLNNVGLPYLTLDRSSATLAGGEFQRIRLASQVGTELTEVIYILDEPSIGLHARDNKKLLAILKKLRDAGNTVIVIEHDKETMLNADWLTDIGPEAGENGGRIIENGPLKKVLRSKKSLTVQYLKGEIKVEIPRKRRTPSKKKLIISGAQEHNLKNIQVEIPLEVMTCITGVSGSGKSTLVNNIIHRKLANYFYHSIAQPGKHRKIEGLQFIDKVVGIDQSPIGRTPRSNPATYTKVLAPIRQLFASTPAAQIKGFTPGQFSFNMTGGRCDNCQGAGFLKVEMQFLPDVYVPCDVCKGKRFKKEILKVNYQGKNIADVLAMTVNEAARFFYQTPQVYNILAVIQEVGLGYIKLGQSATTLSGGEAQRIKLASELAKKPTNKTFYILDEPTTGLHFEDIKKLLTVIQKLVDQKNTVLMIEHNLDVIKSADWIIDLGPEGGEQGGKIVAQGAPEKIIKNAKSYTGKYLKGYL
ncbi:MAG: excinuclease ABC subunit UvrA [Patescibacteria group bacterium]|nr:excinuclease ABC subunit UvrA [Patescibacteria group bacterium]